MRSARHAAARRAGRYAGLAKGLDAAIEGGDHVAQPGGAGPAPPPTPGLFCSSAPSEALGATWACGDLDHPRSRHRRGRARPPSPAPPARARVFVDGWTGKGAIAGELERSLAGRRRLLPRLVTLAIRAERCSPPRGGLADPFGILGATDGRGSSAAPSPHQPRPSGPDRASRLHGVGSTSAPRGTRDARACGCDLGAGAARGGLAMRPSRRSPRTTATRAPRREASATAVAHIARAVRGEQSQPDQPGIAEAPCGLAPDAGAGFVVASGTDPDCAALVIISHAIRDVPWRRPARRSRPTVHDLDQEGVVRDSGEARTGEAAMREAAMRESGAGEASTERGPPALDPLALGATLYIACDPHRHAGRRLRREESPGLRSIVAVPGDAVHETDVGRRADQTFSGCLPRRSHACREGDNRRTARRCCSCARAGSAWRRRSRPCQDRRSGSPAWSRPRVRPGEVGAWKKGSPPRSGGSRLMLMPTLETPETFDPGAMREKTLRDELLRRGGAVASWRSGSGGNDLLACLGLRAFPARRLRGPARGRWWRSSLG